MDILDALDPDHDDYLLFKHATRYDISKLLSLSVSDYDSTARPTDENALFTFAMDDGGQAFIHVLEITKSRYLIRMNRLDSEGALTVNALSINLKYDSQGEARVSTIPATREPLTEDEIEIAQHAYAMVLPYLVRFWMVVRTGVFE